MKTVITTPIFYINAKPHIGHFYSLLLSDALKKTNQLYNKPSILTTGTDEHGLKILQTAQKENKDIHEYCATTSILFKDQLSLSRVSCDDFIRTTEERHKRVVNIVWNQLLKKKLINFKSYEGYYCVSEERFMTNKELTTNEKGEFVTLENKSVELISEDNYFLNINEDVISQFKDLVNYCSISEERDYDSSISSNKRLFDFKLSPNQVNEVMEYIKNELFDFTISRPKSRVPWGIDVPNDNNHVIYVWFDALLNYLTLSVSDHYRNLISKDSNTSNGSDINIITEHIRDLNFETLQSITEKVKFLHVIGKDITKFHCYLLPLMLIASDLLPKELRILTHHHFQVNNIKMSKSLNNSLYANTLIEKTSLNALRYSFITKGPQNKDVSLVEANIDQEYYTDIADVLINLLMRITNKKIFDINEYSIINKNSFDVNFEKNKNNSELSELVSETYQKTIIKLNKIKTSLENYEFSIVSFNIHSILLDLNKLIHTSEFWKLYKNGLEEKDLISLKDMFAFIIETIRVVLIYLYPIVPELVEKGIKVLGFNENEININNCELFIHFNQDKLSVGVESTNNNNTVNANSAANAVNKENFIVGSDEVKLFDIQFDLVKSIFIQKKETKSDHTLNVKNNGNKMKKSKNNI